MVELVEFFFPTFVHYSEHVLTARDRDGLTQDKTKMQKQIQISFKMRSNIVVGIQFPLLAIQIHKK